MADEYAHFSQAPRLPPLPLENDEFSDIIPLINSPQCPTELPLRKLSSSSIGSVSEHRGSIMDSTL
jgi:hypothetical protein